jgi:hypothetical protein
LRSTARRSSTICSRVRARRSDTGKRADPALLRQDPTQTIDAYAGIVKVILNGRVLDPARLAADAKR